jgi:hypothetical protein
MMGWMAPLLRHLSARLLVIDSAEHRDNWLLPRAEKKSGLSNFSIAGRERIHRPEEPLGLEKSLAAKTV